MRTSLILARQIVKDRLLWILVSISVIINFVLLLCYPKESRMCQIACKLIEHYGIYITTDNVLNITQDLNTVVSKASNAYLNSYGKPTNDLSVLYRTGFFESDEEFEEVMLLQRMQTYGLTAIDSGDKPRFFSVGDLTDTRELLYEKFLPMVCVELTVIAVYIMLKTLENSTVARTAPIEYASKHGRYLDILKIKTSLAVVTVTWLLIHTVVIGQFNLIYPGVISTESTLIMTLSKPYFVILLSELTYLVVWLCTEFVAVLIYANFAAAAGLVFRNSLIGFLSVVSCFGVSLGLQSVSVGSNAVNEKITQWSPVSLFICLKDGAIEIQSDEWFLARNPEYVLVGNELLIVAVWLAFSFVILTLAWQFFKRRELTT